MYLICIILKRIYNISSKYGIRQIKYHNTKGKRRKTEENSREGKTKPIEYDYIFNRKILTLYQILKQCSVRLFA